MADDAILTPCGGWRPSLAWSALRSWRPAAITGRTQGSWSWKAEGRRARAAKWSTVPRRMYRTFAYPALSCPRPRNRPSWI